MNIHELTSKSAAVIDAMGPAGGASTSVAAAAARKAAAAGGDSSPTAAERAKQAKQVAGPAAAPAPASTKAEKAGGESGKKPTKKKKKFKRDLTICLENCKYPLVKLCATEMGFRVVEIEEPWNLQWIDTSVSVERVMAMKKFQKINHFPGMVEIARKDRLAVNLGMSEPNPAARDIYSPQPAARSLR